jgi:ATP-dependent Clp protease ATP-binding subunit ClpC
VAEFLELIALPAVIVLALVLGARLMRRKTQPAHDYPTTVHHESIYQLVEQVNPQLPNAEEARNDPAFRQGVERLAGETLAYPMDKLLDFATGGHAVLAGMAGEALVHRPRDPAISKRLLYALPSAPYIEQHFLLRALEHHAVADRSLVGDVLSAIVRRRDPMWLDWVMMVDTVREFVQRRIAAGERPRLGDDVESLDEEQVTHLRKLLERLDVRELSGLEDELAAWERTRVDYDLLSQIGTVEPRSTGGDGPPEPEGVIRHAAMTEAVDELESTLFAERPRSAILVGESGVGKTAIARSLFTRLRHRGWDVFRAGTAEILAGQKHIGELEERLQKLTKQLHPRRRVLWYIPDFHHLAWAGRHQYSTAAALDYLLPLIERGEIVVVGEAEAGAFERLVKAKPRVPTAMLAVRVLPASEKDTRGLARAWSERNGRDGRPLADDETLSEAWSLAQQYLGDSSPPGNLLRFLELTRQRLDADGSDGEREVRISRDDLIATLSRLTGLPDSILDEKKGLDLEALRAKFRSQVLGQGEAVDCLVERVAMIKAGVTDPTRPAGVFLFAGPTGTGKTEIAKTLAEFLFGSDARMIRLDMSELRTPESLPRLLGNPDDRAMDERSLVHEVRKQPFSVILLDEFEKAHPNVWDLFLQVFDDGRLTDQAGRVADFRHSIIVLTSNLGAMVPSGKSLGFSDSGGVFRPGAVLKEVEQAFRRELVNRLDRVVVFRPLTRDTMRSILHKELEEVFRRRGLRNRGWAVEWEDSAVEFLLERGFTVDLGARPLKRAIERYLLSPLAEAIVKHQYPEGDQFLFVRTDGKRLRVAFVDPDAEEEPIDAAPAEVTRTPGEEVSGPDALRTIAAHPTGGPGEVATIRSHLRRLLAAVAEDGWQQSKRDDLTRMSSPEFWESRTRFSVLGRVEYADRIEAGLERAESLLGRIGGTKDRSRSRYPRNVVARLAQQLYLLDTAWQDVVDSRPRDAFLLVESPRGTGEATLGSARFARTVAAMYRGWADRRGMQLEVLEERRGGEDAPYRFLAGVSGYGAYSLLAGEDGLHVHEEPAGPEGRDTRRTQARVRVLPQPEIPPERRDHQTAADSLRAQALEVLAGAETGTLDVVRRYRKEPSPLVRDRVRGWRTGRLDAVLDGDFDLFLP